MAAPSLLIIGCGDLGARLNPILSADGWQLAGVRRRPEASSAMRMHAADYTHSGGLDVLAALRPDYVLTTFTPKSRDIEGYHQGFALAAQQVVAGLGEHRPKRIVMASSTRVYAERNGGWIDESAPLSGDDERAMAIIDAEQTLFAADLATTVVRFGGLYGGPNRRLIDRVLKGEPSPALPVHYTNRMHRDDAAAFLAHLLRLAEAGSSLEAIYNGVDDDPASLQAIEAWLATRMNIDLCPAEPEEADGPTAAGKRCSNRTLHASGFSLRYPDFRAGYLELLPDIAAGAAG